MHFVIGFAIIVALLAFPETRKAFLWVCLVGGVLSTVVMVVVVYAIR